MMCISGCIPELSDRQGQGLRQNQKVMKEIKITISGTSISYEEAQRIGRMVAERDNPEAMAIARFNRQTNSCSPCSLMGDLGGRSGWEVYGENHGGRLKIIVNGGDYIFIFT